MLPVPEIVRDARDDDREDDDRDSNTKLDMAVPSSHFSRDAFQRAPTDQNGFSLLSAPNCEDMSPRTLKSTE